MLPNLNQKTTPTPVSAPAPRLGSSVHRTAGASGSRIPVLLSGARSSHKRPLGGYSLGGNSSASRRLFGACASTDTKQTPRRGLSNGVAGASGRLSTASAFGRVQPALSEKRPLNDRALQHDMAAQLSASLVTKPTAKPNKLLLEDAESKERMTETSDFLSQQDNLLKPMLDEKLNREKTLVDLNQKIREKEETIAHQHMSGDARQLTTTRHEAEEQLEQVRTQYETLLEEKYSIERELAQGLSKIECAHEVLCQRVLSLGTQLALDMDNKWRAQFDNLSPFDSAFLNILQTRVAPQVRALNDLCHEQIHQSEQQTLAINQQQEMMEHNIHVVRQQKELTSAQLQEKMVENDIDMQNYNGRLEQVQQRIVELKSDMEAQRQTF